MPGARILVTRPEPSASRTATLLRQRGFLPVVLPLSETLARDVGFSSDLRVDHVAATSGNALVHANPHLIDLLKPFPLSAVGERTARIARELGFREVSHADHDAQSLAELLLKRTGPGMRIAYLCGTPRKPVVEKIMREYGRDLLALETYQTRSLTPDALEVAASFDAEFAAALVYSPFSARLLAQFLHEQGGETHRTTLFVCLSPAIAEALPQSLRKVVTEFPSEESLIRTLEATL